MRVRLSPLGVTVYSIIQRASRFGSRYNPCEFRGLIVGTYPHTELLGVAWSHENGAITPIHPALLADALKDAKP